MIRKAVQTNYVSDLTESTAQSAMFEIDKRW